MVRSRAGFPRVVYQNALHRQAPAAHRGNGLLACWWHTPFLRGRFRLYACLTLANTKRTYASMTRRSLWQFWRCPLP
nr:MAG TPA: hypothetical protein [Caudoviricetes sp.]